MADAEETDFDICSQVQAGTLEASRPKSNNTQVVSSKEHEDLCIAQVVPDHQSALSDVAGKIHVHVFFLLSLDANLFGVFFYYH